MASADSAAPHATREATARADVQARTQKIRIEQHSAVGLLWFAGWLFTIGLLHLPFGKALLGLIVWPYYIGTMARGWVG